MNKPLTTRRILFTTLIGLFLLVFLCMCQQKKEFTFDTNAVIQGAGVWEEAKQQAANTATASSAKEEKSYEVLNFGVTPYIEEAQIKERMLPILEYLKEKTGISIILNIAPDYDTLQKDLMEKNVQIAAFSPSALGKAIAAIPDKMKYVATTIFDESFYYEGVIFTRKNSGIRSIADMKGKVIAFTDVSSSSGFKYPVAIFLEKGIIPENYFSDVYFLGNHDKVVEAIYNGNVDVGATFDKKFAEFQEKYDDPFIVIERTEPIPSEAWVTSSDISDALVHRFQEALKNLTTTTTLKNGAKVIIEENNLTGFVVKDLSLYNVVIKTDKLVEAYESQKKIKDKNHEKTNQ